MASQELIDYVKKYLEQGVSEEKIRQAILRAGYGENEMNDALAAAKEVGQRVPKPNYAAGPKPAFNFKQFALPAVIVIALLAIAWFVFFGGGLNFISSPGSGSDDGGAGSGAQSVFNLPLGEQKAGISNLVFLSDFTDAGFDTHHFGHSKNWISGGEENPTLYYYSFGRSIGTGSNSPDYDYTATVVDTSSELYTMMTNRGYAHWWGNEPFTEYLKKQNPNTTIEEVGGVSGDCVYLEDSKTEEFRVSKAEINLLKGKYYVSVEVEKPKEADDKERLIALAKIIAKRIDDGGLPSQPDKESGPISAQKKEELLKWCERSNYHAECTAAVAIASDDLELCKEEKWYLVPSGSTQFGPMLNLPNISNGNGTGTNILIIDWREVCFTEYAKYTKNKDVCKEYSTDYCVVTHWSNARKLEHCDQHEVQDDIDDCYSTYAYVWKDRSACELIIDSSLRDGCLKNKGLK